MTNLFKMIKDAAAMQKNAKKMQAELRAKTVSQSSGNGLVTVTARGDASIASIKIDPRAIDPARAEALEGMVLAAVEKALESAKKMSAETMRTLMADMGMPSIPGLGL